MEVRNAALQVFAASDTIELINFFMSHSPNAAAMAAGHVDHLRGLREQRTLAYGSLDIALITPTAPIAKMIEENIHVKSSA